MRSSQLMRSVTNPKHWGKKCFGELSCIFFAALTKSKIVLNLRSSRERERGMSWSSIDTEIVLIVVVGLQFSGRTKNGDFVRCSQFLPSAKNLRVQRTSHAYLPRYLLLRDQICWAQSSKYSFQPNLMLCWF